MNFSQSFIKAIQSRLAVFWPIFIAFVSKFTKLARTVSSPHAFLCEAHIVRDRGVRNRVQPHVGALCYHSAQSLSWRVTFLCQFDVRYMANGLFELLFFQASIPELIPALGTLA